MQDYRKLTVTPSTNDIRCRLSYGIAINQYQRVTVTTVIFCFDVIIMHAEQLTWRYCN